VQSFATSQVTPGSTASFVIWVWSAQAASTGAVVSVTLPSTTKNIGTPLFSVCPSANGTACTIGDLPVGQADELEAQVSVQAQATVGEKLLFTATAKAAGGALPDSSTATDVVVTTVTSSPTTSTTTPLTPLAVPSATPTIAGTGISPTNPASLFPTVGASPTTGTGTGSLNLPPAKSRAALDAASVPTDARLLGGQIAGLAVLACAVAIAITRLSLRRQKVADPNAPKPPDN
jgi:hypothetical protein